MVQCTYDINVTESAILSSINMLQTPKTIYIVGDNLDITNGTIQLNMSDGTTSSAIITAGMVSGLDSSSSGTKSLTVSHGGKQCTYDINVTESAILSSINMLQTPKTTYTVGDSLDVTNGTIQLNMSDGTTSSAIITAGMVSGFDSSSSGTKSLTVSYGGKQCTYDVSVIQPTSSKRHHSHSSGTLNTPVTPVVDNSIRLKDAFTVNKNILRAGYIKGDTEITFNATANITRAEFATMLDRIITINSENNNVYFSDVSKHWAKDSVYRLSQVGIIIGYGDGTFRPNSSISREEISAILNRILIINNRSAVTQFIDINKSFAKNDIVQLYNAGIVKGTDENKFSPKDFTTRAEAVALINRVFLDNTYQEKPNKSTDLNAREWNASDVLKAIYM